MNREHKHHHFEMHSDGQYHCWMCPLVIDSKDYRLEMGGTVDGYYCRECGVEWRCDEEKPCRCKIPRGYAVSEHAK